MDDDLAAEIARIEAELAQDSDVRQASQLDSMGQPMQQQAVPPQQPQAGTASMFGYAPRQVAPQQQQLHAQNMQHQQQMPQQQQLQQPSVMGYQASFGNMAAQQQQQQQQAYAGMNNGVAGAARANMGATSAAGTGAEGNSATHRFSRDSDARSVFVSNLPKGENGGPTTTPEELSHFFSECGQVLNCTILKDRTTQEPKGTAYVEFASFSGMGAAIDTKNNTDFKGSTIMVTHKRSNFKPERGRGGAAGGRGYGGGRGGGRGMAPDPYQAMAALMGMMMGGAYAGGVGRGGANSYHRGGRGRGGRGAGAGPANANTGAHAAGFNPF